MNANLLCSSLSKTVGGVYLSALISLIDGVNVRFILIIFSPLRTGFSATFILQDIIVGFGNGSLPFVKMV